MLNKGDFLSVVNNAPLVSIDLVVRSSTNGLLMGVRKNQPAQGSWFVPGGRIMKGEAIEQAFSRIAKTEIGVDIDFSTANFMGVFTHIYDTNFACVPGVSTHYVVLAYEFQSDLAFENLPKGQHSDYRWIYESDEVEDVHPNSKAYFNCLSIKEDA